MVVTNVNSRNNDIDILDKEVVLLKREIVAINNSLNEQYNMLEALEAVSNAELKCDVCDFKCRKEITLIKHINTNHPVTINGTRSTTSNNAHLCALFDVFDVL